MNGGARVDRRGGGGPRFGHRQLERGVDDLDVLEGKRVASQILHRNEPVRPGRRVEGSGEVVEGHHAGTSDGTDGENCGMTSPAKSRRLARISAWGMASS